MELGFKTDRFEFCYKESRIENSVLWESHCHPKFEMIAVLAGDIGIVLEGRQYRLTDGQAVIVPPLLYHTITVNRRGDYLRLTALFDIAAVPEVLRERFCEKDVRVFTFVSQNVEELCHICGAEEQHRFYEPLAESLMIRIFYSYAQSEGKSADRELDGTLQEILLYIDAHLGDNIRLDDIASHVARSKSSVCHLFREKMGVSPKQYILQKKLALALKLIRDGTPPTVAAVQVGYENYSDFYRMYRKHYRSAPMQSKIKDGAGK